MFSLGKQSDTESGDTAQKSRFRRFPLDQLPLLLAILSLPFALTSFIWIEVWKGVASRAVDGSGHYALAQIYSQSIFPDSFGWTQAYFAGMSFPNFYPPLFFWCVGLIDRTHLVSFATAFKLVVVVPMVLMPVALWAIAWFHGGKNRLFALSAALSCATIYTMGEIFQPNTGLDMSSTILDGFYTQPLGFFLLLVWILIYLLPRQTVFQFVLTAVLLALTVLANFFNAITAILFVLSVLAWDVVKWFRESNGTNRKNLSRTFFLHLLSPVIALGLTAFWIVPMVNTYQYLVTRPLIRSLTELVTTPSLAWYALAVIGFALWGRSPIGRIGPYLTACLLLLVALIFSGSLAPTWFPLQVFRFFSTSNFLLSLPVGISVSYVVKLYLEKVSPRTSVKKGNNSDDRRKRIVFGAFVVIMIVSLSWAMSTKRLTQAHAFYTAENFQRIASVLQFARQHNEGFYLVEVLPSRVANGLARTDSLALNAYLGSQGNRTVSIVYREASPNSSFFNAELNAFSAYRENFGVSSVLMDDLDFIDQPLAQHIERLRFMGVRYLVIATQEMKDRLANEPAIVGRVDIDGWTIFDLGQNILPPARVLKFLPALVVSDFTVKLRTENQYDFVRLAEEQFNDAWFDVLLVRSPNRKLDRLGNIDNFGALILDRYQCDDEELAFAELKRFASIRPLILLSSESSLFKRIQASISEFPKAIVIERPIEPAGKIVEAVEPINHYNSNSVRGVWKAIRSELEKTKTPVEPLGIEAFQDSRSVLLKPSSVTTKAEVPVLLAQTYHPKWVRDDGANIYAATPFYTLTFLNRETRLNFERGRYDRIAAGISVLIFSGFVLLILIRVPHRKRHRPN